MRPPIHRAPAHAAAQQAARKALDRQRGSSAQRGYTSRWYAAARRYLARHSLCVECRRQGRIVTASVVDHVVPHKGDQRLFWDEGNWQPLCSMHHSQKTAGEDGGFGNKVKSNSAGAVPGTPKHQGAAMT